MSPFVELLIAYCFIAYVASFAFCELGYPRLSWFFTATFWLSVGYLFALFPKIETAIIVFILFCVTVLLVGGEREKKRRR